MAMKAIGQLKIESVFSDTDKIIPFFSLPGLFQLIRTEGNISEIEFFGPSGEILKTEFLGLMEKDLTKKTI